MEALKEFCKTLSITPGLYFGDSNVQANTEPSSSNALIQESNKVLEQYLVDEKVQRLEIEDSKPIISQIAPNSN